MSLIKKIGLLSIFLPLTLCGCEASDNTFAGNLKAKYDVKTTQSIVLDPYFKHGYIVNAQESTNAHRNWRFDYNGSADKSLNPVWNLAQWWDPFNFGTSSIYSKSGTKHTYADTSRSFTVDTSNGSFAMSVNTKKEYLYRWGAPIPSGASWLNSLLMQNFQSGYNHYISDLSSLKVKMTWTLDEAHYLGDNYRPQGAECIQYLFYFRILNTPRDGSTTPTTAGMWLGVPLYDSRYNYIEEHAMYDGGFEGATGSVIYSLPSNSYMGNGPVKVNKAYTFEVDVLPYAAKAFKWCQDNGYLTNLKYSNLQLRYFNIGFEIPGGYFDAKATVSNFDITATK